MKAEIFGVTFASPAEIIGRALTNATHISSVSWTLRCVFHVSRITRFLAIALTHHFQINQDRFVDTHWVNLEHLTPFSRILWTLDYFDFGWKYGRKTCWKSIAKSEPKMFVGRRADVTGDGSSWKVCNKEKLAKLLTKVAGIFRDQNKDFPSEIKVAFFACFGRYFWKQYFDFGLLWNLVKSTGDFILFFLINKYLWIWLGNPLSILNTCSSVSVDPRRHNWSNMSPWRTQWSCPSSQ